MLDTPLHPILAHFPVAFFTVGVIVQIIALWKPKFLDPLGFFLIAVGVITGGLTYLTGDAAVRFAEDQGKHIHAMAHTHQLFATLTIIAFGMVLLIRIVKFLWHRLPFFKTLMLVFVVLGAIFITLTGYYGGEMAYNAPTAQQTPQHTTGG